MKGFSGLKAIDTINFRSLLRKNFIDRMVMALTIGLIALTALMGVYAVNEINKGSRKAAARLKDFQSSVAPSFETLSKPPVLETKPRDYSSIASRSIFGSVGAGATSKGGASTQKQASTLPMTLIGTFISKGEEPYAIIEEQKKKSQDVFLLNDMVFGEAKLVAIFPDHVDISRNDKIETLSLDTTPDRSGGEGQGGVTSMGGDEYTVDEAELDKALENLPLLLTQARAVPYFKDGRAVGLRLFAIKTGSLFEKIGLQNGDVLKSVNGNSLADLSQAMQLFQKLKEEKSIAVVMERNMTEKELRYSIR